MINIMIALLMLNTLQPVILPFSMENPVIDGIISEDEWTDGYLFECGMIQFHPYAGLMMDDSMNVYMKYDGEQMYLCFDVFQDTSLLIENNGNRDNGLNQDRIGIVLDPLGKKQEMYWIVVGLSGTVNDSRFMRASKDGEEDYTWDANMSSAVERTARGYVVEMAIPFSNFRLSSNNRQEWNINFYRAYEEEGAYTLYSYNTEFPSDTRYESLLPVVFENIDISREQLEIMPYGIYGAEMNSTLHNRGNAGVDVRYPLNNASVVNVALNPDFSQLEGDPLQFEFNNEYAIYYSEYRPFFTEEMNIFETDNEIFYSRSIVNPYIAAKYSYKDPDNQLGAIVAYDVEDTMIGNTTAYDGVLSYSRQVGEHQFGTMLMERYEKGGKNSFVYSTDGMLKLPNDIKLVYTLAGSEVDDTLNSINRGFYYDSYMFYATSNIYAIAHFAAVSPSFDNDLGYITGVNTQYGGGYVHYRWYLDNDFAQTFQIAENFGVFTPFDIYSNYIGKLNGDSAYSINDSLTQFYETQISSVFLSDCYAQIAVQIGNKFYDNVNLEFLYLNWYTEFTINKYIQGNHSGIYGYTPDYNYARIGKRFQLVENLYYSPLPQLKFNIGSLMYNFNADTSMQSLSYKNQKNLTYQWKSLSLDAGITYSPINNISFKLNGELVRVDFAPDYYDTNRVISLENRLFFIMQYEPSPGNVIYFGARYNKVFQNPIEDEYDRKVIFFKFSSKFFI